MLVSLEAPKVVKDELKKVEVVKPSPWFPKLDSAKFHKLDIVDNKIVRTPVKKLVKDKVTNKEKSLFEKKFEEKSEGASPDVDWAGFPSQ